MAGPDVSVPWRCARLFNRIVLVLSTVVLTACSKEEVVIGPAAIEAVVVTEDGVSRELAISRSARLGEIQYRLQFEIPSDEQLPIESTALISFELADNRTALQLDFRQDPSSVYALTVNGAATDVVFENEHIVLPPAALHPGHNEVSLRFVAGDSSLNRNPDFFYTLFVPDRARTAFPLFDQPDLKARFELTLVVPADWQALANAPLLQRSELSGGRMQHRFAPTEPISSYLFSFVAGEFSSITRQVRGRPMTMLHRETDAAKVARNVDEIFEQHGQSLDWLEDYTGIDYPFEKFDFVLIPGFPYGGMEHVGAIQYRASTLLLDETPPLTDLLRRAQLIAHETAHMWFGNLVTMQWFDDVWTKEVFANFMADKMVNPAFPGVDHELNFLVNHYPAAYAVDRSEGANPIRQPLSNLNQAGQLYGSIIYHKAPIMMRQLELIVGEEGLRRGLGDYLEQFSFGNATWPGLIEILDARTDVDLAAWSEVWVNTPGRPHFRVVSSEAHEEGSALLLQEDPAGRGRNWPQQFDLLILSAESHNSATVLASEPEIPLPLAVAAESRIAWLLSADGRGYGLFPLGMDFLQVWDRLQTVQKGAALITAYDNVLAGSVPDIETYLLSLLAIAQREEDPLLLKLVLGQIPYIYNSLLGDAQRDALRTAIEESLWESMASQADISLTKTVFRYYSELAASTGSLQRLLEIWSGKLAVDKLVLEEEDRVRLAEILAIRLPEKSAEIIARQLADIENPDRRRRLEFIAPSLSAKEAARDAFFASLGSAENRQTERWVSDAVANLHHPSRLAQAEKYVLPGLVLVEEIQVTGGIFFPTDWLEATLANHRSPSAALTVRRFLDQRPDYNPQLRMKILQQADRLFRAAAMSGG